MANIKKILYDNRNDMELPEGFIKRLWEKILYGIRNISQKE